MSSFQFLATIELERTSGKFASRDELVDQLRERLEEAAGEGVSGVGADGDSEYEAVDVDVVDAPPHEGALKDVLAPILTNALQTDGAHHKQWYLEEIAAHLGLDPLKLRDSAPPGVAP